MFKKNVGLIDRTVRIVIGLTFIAMTLTGQIGWWGLIGVVPIATGIMSSCMLYTRLGFSTIGKKKD